MNKYHESLIGRKFGTLIIKEIFKWKKWKYKAVCVCECGAIGYVSLGNLIDGNTHCCTKFDNHSTIKGDIVTVYFHDGLKFLIDKDDYNQLPVKRFTKNNYGYIILRIDGKRILLHRYIMIDKLLSHKYIDHINRNKQDNRRRNLRVATPSLNNHNKGKYKKNGKSKYIGVRIDHQKTKTSYYGRISKHGVKSNLGRYDSAIEAAKAYDKAALVMFGEFACTNKSLGIL